MLALGPAITVHGLGLSVSQRASSPSAQAGARQLLRQGDQAQAQLRAADSSQPPFARGPLGAAPAFSLYDDAFD